MVARKRGAEEVNGTETATQEEIEESTGSGEEQCDERVESIKKEIQSVVDGTHPDLQEELIRLETLRKQRHEALENVKALKVRNVKQLHDFERLHAKAKMEAALKEQKLVQIDEIMQRLRRVDEWSANLRGEPTKCPLGRLPPPAEKEITAEELMSYQDAEERIDVVFRMTLSDEEMRHDFQEIVDDIKKSSEAFLAKHPGPVSMKIEKTQIQYGKEKYRVGSWVRLTWMTRQAEEHLVCILYRITPDNEVIFLSVADRQWFQFTRDSFLQRRVRLEPISEDERASLRRHGEDLDLQRWTSIPRLTPLD